MLQGLWPSNRRKRKGVRPSKPRSHSFEPLERRELLSITWTGSGANNNWSTAANWSGGVAPGANADLVFAGTAQTSTNNDLTGLQLHSIEFQNNGFSIGGNNLTVTSGIKVDSGVTGSTVGVGVALTGAASVDVEGSNLTLSGIISGSSGSLSKVGSGTLDLTANSSYSGGTTVSAGTLLVQNYSLPSGGIAIASGALLDYNTTAGDIPQQPTTFTGSGTLQVDGGHRLIFGGTGGNVNVSFSAGALINVVSGTLTGSSCYNAQWTNDNASLNIAAGATFDGVEGNICINALTGAGTFQGGWGPVTETIGVAGGSGTFSGIVQNNGNGTLSLVKTGSGTETLGGTNTYGGSTTILGGTLQTSGTGTGSDVAHYAFDGNANDTSGNGNNGTLVGSPTFTTGRFGQAVSLNGSSQYVTVPYSAGLGLNAYTVSTWVDIASQPAVNSVSGPALVSTRNGSDGTFDLQYMQPSSGTYELHGDIGTGSSWLSTAANYMLPSALSGWNMVTYAVSSSGYTIYLNGAAVTSGSLGGTPLFMKSGQTLSFGSQEAGTASYGNGGYLNGALDEVNIASGALNAAQIGNLYLDQVGKLPAATVVSIAAGATLDLDGSSQTVAGLSNVAGGGGTVTSSAGGAVTLTLAPTTTTTFSGVLQNGSGTLGLTIAGTSTQVLTGANTYGGSTNILSGTLQTAGAGNDVAHYAFDGNANDTSGNGNNGTLVGSPTFTTGRFGQAVSLNGSSQYVTVPYSAGLGLNAYTVSTWVDITTQPAVNGGSGPALVSTRNGGDATFDLQYVQAPSGTYELHGDIGTGSGWLSTAANYTLPGALSGWNMITYAVSSSGYTIYVNGAAVASASLGGTPLFMKAGQTLAFGTQEAGGGSYGSEGYLNGALDEVNIASGTLSTAQIGNLYLDQVGAVNVLPASTVVSIAAGATLDLDGSSQTIAGLSNVAGGGGTVTNSAAGAVTLTLAPTTTTTFSGAIQNGSGTVGLTIAGAGTQVLTGANTYSGGTTVSAGTLSVGNANALGGSSTTIASGGAVSIAIGQTGPWTVSNNFVLNGGEILSNDSSDTLSGSLTANAVSTLSVPAGDTLVIGGTITGRNNLTETSGGTVVFGTPSLPSGWSDADIGTPDVAGSASYSGTTWTVAGGGSDIWNNADQFNFASESWTGNGTIIAQVNSLTNTDSWTKAGVMFRNDTTAGSAYADVVATEGQGVAFQWRTSAGGGCNYAQIGGINVPVWVELVRSGSNFSGYYSTNGTTWTQVGTTQTVTMNNTALAGLAVTAHNNGLLDTATFTNVSLVSGNPPPTVATPAAATPNPVTGTTTNLSVLGADQGGQASLTYTWSTTGTPPAAVSFSANGTNAAQDTTATFTQPGTYGFLVTITDPSSLFTTSSVSVTVVSTLTSIVVTPGSMTVYATAIQQFAAVANDQFGHALTTQPAFTWSTTVGTVSTGGLLTASSSSVTGTVTATSGTIGGSGNVTVDSTVNRTAMIAILQSVEALNGGVLSQATMTYLQTLLTDAAALSMPGYVQTLASYIIDGNPANAHYQGQTLGDLAVGSSAVQLDDLIDKWFLGTDLPAAEGYAYGPMTGPLFGSSGPSVYDEHQGFLGDCYLISSLGAIADSSQAAIENMILPNGDGTWTVRFYEDSGVADYVTVNDQVPGGNGGFIFDDAGESTTNPPGGLWIPLIEKAYAQWSETGNEDYNGNTNTYVDIGNGGYNFCVYSQVLGNMSQGFTEAPYWYSEQVSDAVTSNEAVTVCTAGGGDGLVQSHVYAVTAYNATNQTFTLYNPWGTDQPGPLTWAQLEATCAYFVYQDASGTQPLASTPAGSSLPPGASSPALAEANPVAAVFGTAATAAATQPFATSSVNASLLAATEPSAAAVVLSAATNDSTTGRNAAIDSALAGLAADSLGGGSSLGDHNVSARRAAENDKIDSALRGLDEIQFGVSSGEISAHARATAIDRVFAMS
jgi:autotransporter-associated beta strand protein